MRTLVAISLALGLALGAGGAQAVGGLSAEAIQSASTAADHNRIAEAYAEEAAGLRQKAADHKAMLASYDKGPGYLKEKSGLPQHCRSLISYYEKAAADADVMAKTHRELAAKAK